MPNAISNAVKELFSTVKKLPQDISLFAYLGSSMFYRDALNGLYAFGGIYAAGVLGWSIVQIGIFGIIAAITAADKCILYLRQVTDMTTGLSCPVQLANMYLIVLDRMCA